MFFPLETNKIKQIICFLDKNYYMFSRTYKGSYGFRLLEYYRSLTSYT